MQGFADELIDQVAGVGLLEVEQGEVIVFEAILQSSQVKKHGAFGVVGGQEGLVLLDEALHGGKLFEPEAKAHNIVKGEAREVVVFNKQATL